MERQGQLTPEARVTEYGVTYLWFDPQQVEALALARAERAAGQRPRGVAGPAPKPPRVDE